MRDLLFIHSQISVVRVYIPSLVVAHVFAGGVIYFGLNCALASISAFLPSIVKTFGYRK